MISEKIIKKIVGQTDVEVIEDILRGNDIEAPVAKIVNNGLELSYGVLQRKKIYIESDGNDVFIQSEIGLEHHVPKGIIKTDKFTDGDSTELYGNEYIKDKDGNMVNDDYTGKNIMESFTNTHGQRIMDAMFDALQNEDADEFINLSEEDVKKLERGLG